MSYKQTSLWKDAFEARAHDEYANAREWLRVELIRMRDRVNELISHIPSDCRELTIHDITHLDALWDCAETISGPSWKINPAEAFVFGAAVLTHDAALTTIAYPEGKAGIKKTSQWADISASHTDREKDKGGTDQDQNKDLEATLLFEALRHLHAEQAETLCVQPWSLPGRGEIYLIEDSELREAYGESIGRIASSHHWNHEKLRSEFQTKVGGSPRLPVTWSVNERKLACLLRCADAAQVDRTRAPVMLYAALGPKGYSELHWRAQRKLNRPIIDGSAIRFSSSSSFDSTEADAWWVAYDLARTLDKELRSSNAILADSNETPFIAQRVIGAESPEAFSCAVKTNEWRPIDASIRITDPLSIARTLGGRNLYGSSPLVPFRELIQNAADAIRQRRALETRGLDLGLIKISIEKHSNDDDACLVHVDDNGIGMSERVLCTSLVDFGKSFWKSSLMREEFPGLSAARVKTIGKFGIGFFSLFELTQDITVTSRRYDSGHKDARTLEFKGLMTRPLLRETKGTILPSDTHTRVTLSIAKSNISILENSNVKNNSESHHLRHYPTRKAVENTGSLKDAIRSMVSFLDIRVKFIDHRSGDAFEHAPEIYERCNTDFRDEVFSFFSERECTHFNPVETIRPLRSPNEESFGRAALDIDSLLRRKNHAPRSFVSIGGIVSELNPGRLRIGSGAYIPYYGVIEGRTERAARDVSSIIATEEVVADWLIDQVEILDKSILRTSEIMHIASFLLEAIRHEFDLPYSFNKGKTKTVLQTKEAIRKLDSICFPITWRYDSWPEVIGYNILGPEYFEVALIEELFILSSGSERLLDEDDAKLAKRRGEFTLDRDVLVEKWSLGGSFLSLVEQTWGCELSISISLRKLFDTNISSLTGERWIVSIRRDRVIEY